MWEREEKDITIRRRVETKKEEYNHDHTTD